MVTIKDVAKKCGFSVCTVSRALSGKGYLKEETRKKIMEAVEELNYRPNTLAVNLKTGRRQTLALILPSLTNIFYTKLEQYMESFASLKGYLLYLCNTEYSLEKEKQVIDNLVGMDIAGVIIFTTSGEHGHIKKLSKFGIPYVYMNRSFEDDMEHCLRLNNKKAAYEAVNYMIRLGHQNIGGIFQSFANGTHQERYEGMMEALDAHGLSCHPGHLLFDVNPEDMGSTPNQILGLLQQPDRPEAIFACNDMMAFNLYRAAYILGLRIPDHLSIFGFDDCIMANFVTPPLSTVSVPAKQMSSLAVDFIHHHIQTGTTKELPLLNASLVIRNSVKNLVMS
ncbi:MAG: LacI family transcriptional regulator [Lachnospiraceae bacterium]|nr:LacI family transcriptional regulator [Lachnospiraceae bacterium]